MGTTLTAILWDGSRIGVAQVGDSRAYRLRDGAMQQLTLDQTFVQSLVNEGRTDATGGRAPSPALSAPAGAGRPQRRRARRAARPAAGR